MGGTCELRVLVIIPAYNEEEAILTTVSSVVEAGYDYVVVNDGSTDKTLELCRANGVNVLDLPSNLGIGGAVQSGHKYAQRNGYDVDVQFDGDGQHDVAYIPDLLSSIDKGNDVVVGSRFIEEPKGFQSTLMRRIGKTWLAFLIRLFVGLNVTDPTSGFRACGKKAIELYSAEYPTDYPEPESLVVATRSGLSVGEVPVVMRERQGGSSSIGLVSSVYYMIKVTLAIAIATFSKTR
ncbi:MAG: glycosyltransferase family 2 protein [Collinsella intestinalis]|uniref:Glycosyltransferase family 2 protein n=1 Tax=Collinsella intestinalis TaxID=147207 RepID=A0A943GQU5_9ACTN|nr:glycosyltransferase family 2 protein [Collinsella intestinalis]